MALNFGNSGADFFPWTKYNAKAGRWYIKKDEVETEIAPPTFVADFANIRTGWIYLREGTAPEIVYDPSLTQAAPKPERTYVDDKGAVKDCFKRGFSLRVFSNNAFGGVVELQSPSMHLRDAIDELHDIYVAGVTANPGMLPVVQCTGSTPMKDKFGTNYKPTFIVLKWVPRPAEFDAAKTPAPPVRQAPAPQAYQQPAPVYQQPPAPAPQPAPAQPAPAVASVSEF